MRSLPVVLACVVGSLCALPLACGANYDDVYGGTPPGLDAGSGEGGSGGGQQQDGGAGQANDAGSASDAAPDTGTGEDAGLDSSIVDSGKPETGSPLCAPPADPSKAALCVRLVPEQLDLLPGDSTMDGRGTFIVSVFDNAYPTRPDGSQVRPIDEQIYPSQGGFQTAYIYSNIPVFRFELPPGKRYVRALFVDNKRAFQDKVVHGLWIGGYDLSKGIKEHLTLRGASLQKGTGTPITLHLQALRKIVVRLAPAPTLTFLGNGEGPGGFAIVDSQQFDANHGKLFGFGEVSCYRLLRYNHSPITGVAVGSGPRYVFGWVDDFGTTTTNKIGDGTIINVVPGSNPPKIPLDAKIHIPPRAYHFETTVQLNAVVPGNPGADTTYCL